MYGLVEFLMPEMGDLEDRLAVKNFFVPHYAEINRAAIREMFRQAGNLVLDDNGIAKKGLLIRHLVLPGGLSGTGGIMKFLAEEISKDAYISLMSQYFPAFKATEHEVINRRITAEEYEEACRIMEKYGLENGWIQNLD